MNTTWLRRMILATAMALTLSACERLGVAKTLTPEVAVTKAHEALDKREYAKVEQIAKSLADKEGVHRGTLCLLLAKSYAMSGRGGDAINYLRIAIREKAIEPAIAMTDESFQGINTELPFVQLMTEQ